MFPKLKSLTCMGLGALAMPASQVPAAAGCTAPAARPSGARPRSAVARLAGSAPQLVIPSGTLEQAGATAVGGSSNGHGSSSSGQGAVGADGMRVSDVGPSEAGTSTAPKNATAAHLDTTAAPSHHTASHPANMSQVDQQLAALSLLPDLKRLTLLADMDGAAEEFEGLRDHHLGLLAACTSLQDLTLHLGLDNEVTPAGLQQLGSHLHGVLSLVVITGHGPARGVCAEVARMLRAQLPHASVVVNKDM